MKTKLSLLVSGITTIATILALALSQSTTNSSAVIHELTDTEMTAITGTGVCRDAWEFQPSDKRIPSYGDCNSGPCDNDDDQCGTDYTYFAEDWRCWGAIAERGYNACEEFDTSNALWTKHNCYCKDRMFGSDICEDDTEDSSFKAKDHRNDPNTHCDGINP